jgi:hypothetical protein
MIRSGSDRKIWKRSSRRGSGSPRHAARKGGDNRLRVRPASSFGAPQTRTTDAAARLSAWDRECRSAALCCAHSSPTSRSWKRVAGRVERFVRPGWSLCSLRCSPGATTADARVGVTGTTTTIAGTNFTTTIVGDMTERRLCGPQRRLAGRVIDGCNGLCQARRGQGLPPSQKVGQSFIGVPWWAGPIADLVRSRAVSSRH